MKTNMPVLLDAMTQTLRKASLLLLTMWLVSETSQAQKQGLAPAVTSQAFVICENCVNDSVIYSNIVNNPVHRADQNLKRKSDAGQFSRPQHLRPTRFRASGSFAERFFPHINDPAMKSRVLSSQTIAQFSDVLQQRHYEVRSQILNVTSGTPDQGMKASSETGSSTGLQHVSRAQSSSLLFHRRQKRVLK